MLDILDATKHLNNPGLMVFIDFEKAFDSVSWNFLYKTLTFFNFGQTFCNYIKLLYSNPRCCVMNNGHSSQFFNITRGIRQGCPVSALLFLLCVEILALNIANDDTVKGLLFDDKVLKMTQYADDTCLFVENTESLENALTIFENFYRYAGLRLNKEKTDIIWLGKNNRQGKINDINIINKPAKSLGIWLCMDPAEVIKINLDERIEKCVNFEQWLLIVGRFSWLH